MVLLYHNIAFKNDFCYNWIMKKEVELPKKTAEKIKMREKKIRPKMPVSGKSVFKLKKIINK
jgi:hypothetical protein